MTSGRRLTVAAAGLLALACVYFVAAKLGLKLAFLHASATPVWPPTGIALAAMLVLGQRVWPGIMLGAFAANVTTEGSVATSLGIATGNTLEAVVGALLVRRFARGRRAFERARDIFTFAILAGLLSTTLSATIGVTTLSLGGYAEWHRYADIWLTWWLGDAAGDLVVAPLLLLWSTPGGTSARRAGALEGALLSVSAVLVASAVFNGVLAPWITTQPLEFLCVPPLIWAAYRFGLRESATVIVLLSGIAIWGTLRGFGPFVRPTQNESLLLLQAFMATMALMTLTFAAVVAQRREAEAAVRERDRLRVTSGLAAAAGHEINNPLAVVIGQAQLLAPAVSGQDLARVNEILHAGERIAEVVRYLKHVDRLAFLDDQASGLPEMLDLQRSGGGVEEPG